VDALYQKQILDYAQKSRSCHSLKNATHTATVDNPVCGDRVDISLAVIGHKIDEMGVKVRGCALCEAGAGLAIACLTGQNTKDIESITADFAHWIEGTKDNVPMPQMQHFTPVREIKNRHKCVLLAFHAAVKALKDA